MLPVNTIKKSSNSKTQSTVECARMWSLLTKWTRNLVSKFKAAYSQQESTSGEWGQYSTQLIDVNWLQLCTSKQADSHLGHSQNIQEVKKSNKSPFIKWLPINTGRFINQVWPELKEQSSIFLYDSLGLLFGIFVQIIFDKSVTCGFQCIFSQGSFHLAFDVIYSDRCVKCFSLLNLPRIYFLALHIMNTWWQKCANTLTSTTSEGRERPTFSPNSFPVVLEHTHSQTQPSTLPLHPPGPDLRCCSYMAKCY